MATWYLLLEGPPEDVTHVKRLITASEFTLDHMDGKDALSGAAFKSCKDSFEVIEAGTKLLASINTALRIAVPSFTGLEFHGIVEKRADGSIHRTMLVQGGSYGISGASAVAIAGSFGKPVRSKEERLASLIRKRQDIADIASRLAARPLAWSAMRAVYETVAGLMSDKSDPAARRSDYRCLITKGWLTKEESEKFYHTAAHDSHGYPKSPNRAKTPMEHSEARNLINRLFWRLVDELEPE